MKKWEYKILFTDDCGFRSPVPSYKRWKELKDLEKIGWSILKEERDQWVLKREVNYK